MWTENLEMYKLDLEKAEEPEIKLSTTKGIPENIYFYFIDYAKTFDWVDLNNYGQFLNRCEYQAPLPVSWETCMQVKEQQLELDMEQWTGSKLRKGYDKAVYCHPIYLAYRQSTSCEMSGWMNCKLESRLLGEIPQICRWYHSNGRTLRGTKEPFDEGERGEWKNWLKTQYWKN